MDEPKVPIKVTDNTYNPKRCPSKHARAYQTSFGGKYCPDCGHNIKNNE
jgi:hypothetical protein